MKTLQWAGLSVLLISLAVAGCQDKPDSQKEQAKVYDVKAKVVAVDKGKKTVTLDHEDIPGLMKAMQMSFAVADAKILDDIKPGDAVEGKLQVKSGTNTITELRKR